MHFLENILLSLLLVDNSFIKRIVKRNRDLELWILRQFEMSITFDIRVGFFGKQEANGPHRSPGQQ